VPEFERQTLDTKVVVPDGRTVVFGGWKTTPQEANDDRNDFLKGVPVLDSIVGLLEGLAPQCDLLGNRRPDRTPQRMVMLVTPRIIVNEEIEEANTPPAVRPTPVASRPEGTDVRERPAPDVTLARVATAGKPRQVPRQDPVTAAQHQREMVTRLLRSYREACARGNHAEAQKLAQMALALDPLCFERRR
jgi:hypothetical protein